jgi:ATP-dependent Clp protease adaptor protein ClpS
MPVPENEKHDTRFEEVPGVDEETGLEEPRMYRVILHNDHYTTMDFVVAVLMKIFQRPAAEAVRIMLDVHRKGVGMCGVYTYDVAVTKVSQVHRLAKENGYPLKCSYEEA